MSEARCAMSSERERSQEAARLCRTSLYPHPTTEARPSVPLWATWSTPFPELYAEASDEASAPLSVAPATAPIGGASREVGQLSILDPNASHPLLAASGRGPNLKGRLSSIRQGRSTRASPL